MRSVRITLTIAYWLLVAYLVALTLYGCSASIIRSTELREAGNEDAAQATLIMGFVALLFPAIYIGVAWATSRRINKGGLIGSLLLSFVIIVWAATALNI